MLETDDLLGRLHLVASQSGHVAFRVAAARETLVQDAAPFSGGAAHDHDLGAAVHVVGVSGSAFAGFVVGMGVHCHEAQGHFSVLLSLAD